MISLLISGLLLSVGWLARGQFGHEWGAMIPGGCAAVAVALSSKNKIWKESFAQSVFWAAGGFALGGGFSFGSLVGKITAAPHLYEVLPLLLQVFFIGAIWGGLGMIFLGFALSGEKNISDIIIFGISALLVWSVNNLFSVTDRTVLAISLVILFALIFYRYFKQDQLSVCFGVFGFVSFGAAFLISVLLLYWGDKGFLPGTWWQVSDMIWGFLGGLGVYFASARANQKGWLPKLDPAVWIERGGFTVFVGVITGINLWNVYQKWFQGTSQPVNLPLAWLLFTAFCLAVLGAILLILRADPSCFSFPKLPRTLISTALFYVWILGFLAIAKSVGYTGWSAWQPVFTVILIENILLALILKRSSAATPFF